jgi:misacylated tRNA(Ala) deacylase
MMLPESLKTLRIVSIGDVDSQACGGTHLKNTSEIKGISITKTENKGKNNRRLYFVLND